jgi:peptidoglycan/LPS O-acetylase OafA/YrhL
VVVIASALSQATAMGRVLGVPILVALGRISYGVYLWHFPVYFFLAKRYSSAPHIVLIPGILLASMLVATASFWLIERPFLKLKGRVKPGWEKRKPDLSPTATHL